MKTTAHSKNKTILGAIAGIAVAGLLARTVKGIVSLVPNLLSLTPKESVRPVPKASRLGDIFQTAGLGAIYGLLFAGLLFAPLLPHLAAQSSGSSNTPQAGDEIEAITIGGAWKK